MTAINRRVLRTGYVRVAYRVGALLCAVAMSGCGFDGYKSDFPVVVGNRPTNTITVFANGTEMGNVGAGGLGSFTVRLRENGSYGYQTDSSSTQVTFSARDLTTGKLSISKHAVIFQDPPTRVDFTDGDFQTTAQGLPSTTALAVSFTFSPLDPFTVLAPPQRGPDGVFGPRTGCAAGGSDAPKRKMRALLATTTNTATLCASAPVSGFNMPRAARAPSAGRTKFENWSLTPSRSPPTS